MQTTTKRKFDPKSPEIRAYLDDVRYRTFTSEGMMVAFPTCYPGITAPIPLDESRITALDITPEGVIYGATSGYRAHLFVGSFHGVQGLVFDLGLAAGPKEGVAVCCGAEKFLAFVNGPGGGRAVGGPVIGITGDDFIQEWGMGRPVLTDHGECVPGEPVVAAVADASRKTAVAITAKHLVTLDIAEPKARVVGEVPGSGKLARGSRGGIFGRDEAGTLWRFDPVSGSLQRKAVKLPQGFGDEPLSWSAVRSTGVLYTADAEGKLYSFDEEKGFSDSLGSAPLSPVGPMAVTLDGRLFGFCGDELAKMFSYNPSTREVTTLGVAVSVIERRRYAYVMGAAVTGRDGELYFGENDNGGHLWLYFPRIQAVTA